MTILPRRELRHLGSSKNRCLQNTQQACRPIARLSSSEKRRFTCVHIWPPCLVHHRTLRGTTHPPTLVEQTVCKYSTSQFTSSQTTLQPSNDLHQTQNKGTKHRTMFSSLIHSIPITLNDLSNCPKHTRDSCKFHLFKRICLQKPAKHPVQDVSISTLPCLPTICRFTLPRDHVATQVPRQAQNHHLAKYHRRSAWDENTRTRQHPAPHLLPNSFGECAVAPSCCLTRGCFLAHLSVAAYHQINWTQSSPRGSQLTIASTVQHAHTKHA